MKLPFVIAKELSKAAILGAAGGSRAIKNSTSLPKFLARDLSGSVFSRENQLNFTAVTLLGHMIIASRILPRISDTFARKYGVPTIWDMGPPGPKDGYDLQIKKAAGAKFSRDLAAERKIADYFSLSK